MINLFHTISFAHTWVLSFLLGIPILVYHQTKNRNKAVPSFQIITTQFLSTSKSTTNKFYNIPLALRCCCFFCWIIALARPQKNIDLNTVEGKGIDIVLCFDVSGSMAKKDITPSRLAAAKEIAIEFVQKRLGDRIGVVVFTKEGFTLCPLTTDQTTVLNQIHSIETGYLPNEGTAICSGIATCIDRLKESKTTSKIIILMTDGLDYGGAIRPKMTTQMANLYAIKVYTVLIGNEVIKFQNKNNQPNNFLQSIANETGGEFFRANDRNALVDMYDTINTLQKSDIFSQHFVLHNDLFHPFIWVGMLCCILELILQCTVLRKFP